MDIWVPSPAILPRMMAGEYTNTAPTSISMMTEKTSITFCVLFPR